MFKGRACFKAGVMDVVLACAGVRVCLRMNRRKLKNGGGGRGEGGEESSGVWCLFR